ncbi:MAG: hypothetical protein IKV35_00005, partial [Clostridia bacterium]|nr:hypothetical protein [Clostridia bacterium]
MKRILCFVLVVSLMIACLPMVVSAAPTERTLNFAQLSGGYRVLGRAMPYQSQLLMDNTASGFEMYFNGSGDVTFNASVMCINWGNELAQYFTVVVDGVRSRVRVEVTEHAKYEAKQILIAENLASGDHHIEVYRQTEASQSFCVGTSVTFTGTLLAPPPQAHLTFDVIGDSISGGYGALWDGTSHQGFHPKYQDGTQTYAFLTGKAFGADVRVCQVSGYGCVRGQNTNGDNMQKLYPYLCYNRDETPYPFDTLADVVIINLGTNDSRVGVTGAEFQVGAKNLMQIARDKNPGAKIVWCTGMMGTFYGNEVQAAVKELGGASNGFFYVNLPYGGSGAGAHPAAKEHQAAATVLQEFLRTNVLTSETLAAQTDAATLRAAVKEASAIANPSAALKGAIDRATTELNVNTTDPYRLYQRLEALEAAKNAIVKGVSLMPKEYISDTPVGSDGTSYVWPSYMLSYGWVSLYKGGAGHFWPVINTPVAESVDVDETPYLRLEFESTASFNVSIAYRAASGETMYVKASELAGIGDNDFTPRNREVMMLDFAAYVREKGHVGDNGLVSITSCQMFVVGSTDQVVQLFDCSFTSAATTASAPTKLSGSYTVQN